ncbi:hypothetical protein RB195_015549 [Necator americanus]|uniref:Uncharacterized protein n=1 Tax=Necator americanus TaxID=51031 RepID=A0ABR1E5I5_NECAM
MAALERRRRRMQNELPSTCVYSCWSTDQEDTLRCGFLYEKHPGRCKVNLSGSNTAEEVCLCICKNKLRQDLRTVLYVSPAPLAISTRKRKRKSKELRRQLQQDRDKEWTSRAKELEKAWENKNPRKAYSLSKQYCGKMKRANGEAILPIWRGHFKTLLNRQAPSGPQLKHIQQTAEIRG